MMFPQLTSPHLHFISFRSVVELGVFRVRIPMGGERGMTIVVVVVIGFGLGFVVGGINVGVPVEQGHSGGEMGCGQENLRI